MIVLLHFSSLHD